MSLPQYDNGPRVVLVTGASSGIGRETALRFARRHDCLVLAARSEDALARVADECRAAGAADVLFRSTDIGNTAAVQQLFTLALHDYGRIDVVAQCAAITAFGRFEALPVDAFDGIVQTNLLGSANVARCALVHFQERGVGQLVLVGSLLGVTAVPYQSAYVVSKFAICGLVRALRQEHRHLPGVRVHGVYPGPVDTPVYGTSDNYLGRAAKVPPTADAPGTIAAAIVRAADRKHSTERQIGWFNRPAIAVYRLFPAVFDALIGPLLRATTFAINPDDDAPNLLPEVRSPIARASS